MLTHQKTLFSWLTLLLIIYAGQCRAGGLDSSGRPFDIIFGQQNELRFSINYVEPLLSASASRNVGAGTALPAIDASDIVDGYSEPMIGGRIIFNDETRCAAQIERPFRLDTRYQDDTLSYAPNPAQPTQQIPAPLKSEYKSASATLACQYGFQFDQSRLSLIGGPVYQTVSGIFSADLTNQNLGDLDNYEADLDGSNEWGYLLGFAYEIPAIAFRASLFYHNEMHYQLDGDATAPLPDFSGTFTLSATGKTLTPQAVNFNIQSGIAENWLAFAELRWGDWSALDEVIIDAGPLSQRVVLFSNDTLNYKLGLGYRVSSTLSLGGHFASLINLGNENLPPGLDGTNLRNPQSDRYSLGFGASFKPDRHVVLEGGVSYFYIVEGTFADPYFTVDLKQSNAVAVAGAIKYLF